MAKAQNTKTTSAAAASEDGTKTGKVGTTVEERERLAAVNQSSPDGEDTDEGEGAGEGEDTDQGEGTGEGEGAGEGEGTGEGEDDGEGEGTGEGAVEGEGDPDLDEGKIKDGEIKGLPSEIQAKVNKRIHGLNIKRKNAEAKAEQTEAQFKILNTKLQDENIQAAIKLGFDPNYGTAEDAKKLNRVENLQAWRSFYREYVENGYEGSGVKDDQSMNAAEVKRKLYAVEDELMDIGGSVRSKAMERMALKDADAAVGRKIRLEGANKSTTTPPKKVNPKPPKLPEGGATRRPPVSTAGKGKSGFDQKEFNNSARDENALEEQYKKIFG